MKIVKSSGVLPSQIADALGISVPDANFAIKATGAVGVITTSGRKFDDADFASRLSEELRSQAFASALRLIDVMSLSERFVSPPELLAQAHTIGFVQPRLLGGIPFWNLDEVNRHLIPCAENWITPEKLAEWSSLTIPQITSLVINGDLPRIKPKCFLPGWDQSALASFIARMDINPVPEAGEYDVEHGRIYQLLDAPEPLRALDLMALQQAYFGQVGHPLLLDDGTFGWVAEHVHELIFPPRDSDEGRRLSLEALEGLTG